MDLRTIQMVKMAAKPYQVVGQEGDKVLLIADHFTDPEVIEAFALAASNLDMEPIVLTMPRQQRDYEDPPLLVERAAENADVIHYLTTLGLVHSQFGGRMSEKGKKRIISEGITGRMLTEGAALADPQSIRDVTERLAPYWDAGNHVHVTTPHGTDFSVGIGGRTCYSSYAKNVPLGSALRAQFPGGECPVPPLEYSGQGTVVIDISIHHPRGLLRKPIRMEMKDGYFTDISGGHQADKFAEWLDTYGDNESRRFCELSIGTNPSAIFMGSPRQDRFVLGSVHVGFGKNNDVGGVIDSILHYDGIMSQPTVEVDGTLIVRDGDIVV